jgi:GTP-binding protein
LRSGKQGEDEYLDVPLGTIAKDAETGEVHFEVTEDGQEFIIVPGGRGGLGNNHFKTATNQAPSHAQPGEPGQDVWKILELKVLADVGLVGFPNAGKSTLLAAVSAAKPEIADYPFTTIVPNLGMVRYRNDRSFVMADIPGIIEGASEGKGLGHRFLRHIERNATLLFMIACDTGDIKAEYDILLQELEKFNPQLLHKNRILAITKCDMLDDQMMNEMEAILPQGVPHIFISAVSNMNIDRLKDMIWSQINAAI